MPSLGTKVFRFSTSGAATTLLHLLVASFCAYAFAFSGTASNGVAFIIANGFSYLMNSIWSFEAGISIAGFQRFFLVSVIGLLATLAISAVVEWLGYPAFYSIATVVVLLPALSFIVHNLWTFRT
ncbi:GtrA family protein [Phyllobacterium salinisoli]|uniref:GtrA family protein n=1 Tax=Phyllobacterium salinisoli TaxID=1899321 RepID=UPI00247ADD02|nr:GtrA family protein [Phyllobacterium salinisoli]